MLSNYLQQTTSADDILRCFFLGALRVNEVLNQPNQQQIYYCADSLSTPVQETNMFSYALISAGPREWCWNPSLKGEGVNYPEGSSRC